MIEKAVLITTGEYQDEIIPKESQLIVLDGITQIGRKAKSEEASVIFNIKDSGISRKHAEIYLDGNTYYARDLGSKYGTSVNEQSITLARTVLKDGDQIQLGPKTILQFHLQMAEEEMDDNELTKKYEFEEDEKTLVRK